MLNPFDSFDKIYCINLKEREDRWLESQQEFSRLDIFNYERFEGVRVQGKKDQRTNNQAGCTQSYCNVIDDSLKKGFNTILILEDDFSFLDDKKVLFDSINLAISQLPEDWDALYFGGSVSTSFHSIPVEKYSDNLLKLNCALATHSILYSRRGLVKLREMFKDDLNWSDTIAERYSVFDVFLAKDYLSVANCYITSELLCYQRASFSDIDGCDRNYRGYMTDLFTRNTSSINL